jgi:hypothetical protein
MPGDFKGEGAMSPARGAWTVALLAVWTLTGCGTARTLSRDSYGGVVAIPENSDVWPTHYRTKAIEMIKKDCPDYEIVAEKEVVVGSVTTNRESTDVRNQDLTPKSSRYGATLQTTDTTRTRETHDQTEWRIYYHKKGAPLPPAPMAQVPPPGPMPPVVAPQPPPVLPASTLPPTPVPIGQ